MPKNRVRNISDEEDLDLSIKEKVKIENIEKSETERETYG